MVKHSMRKKIIIKTGGLLVQDLFGPLYMDCGLLVGEMSVHVLSTAKVLLSKALNPYIALWHL